MFGREKRMPRLEDYSETHDGGVNFVMDVFRSMGGAVLPPKRPRHIPKYTPLTVARDAFMMDFENFVLEQDWDSTKRSHPKGPKRHEDREWADTIQSRIYPHTTEIDWEEYVEWVSAGHGDEYFQEEEEALFCGRHDEGPLDVWYDCDACVQEVQGGPMPQDGRYVWSRCPINGG